MDFTPKRLQDTSDSGIISSSFDNSSIIYGSTPTECTPTVSGISRKRKISFRDGPILGRKLTDVLELSPSSPQFCSSFNDSLTSQFSHCRIQSDCYYDAGNDQQHNKVRIESLSKIKRIHSAPCTPEKQIKVRDGSARKPNSFVKVCPEESPLKEARSILYPKLPSRKILSPLKFKENLEKFKSPAKKCLFLSKKDLLQKVISNNIIMGQVFKYLSDGDLYRVNMVSKSFRDVLSKDIVAYHRYLEFKEKHKRNKENYQITPPASPEKLDESPPSPKSRNFINFIKRASSLEKNQSMTKCPMCSKPSVVENGIAQCESLTCGYICCLKCCSYSYNPEDFHDKCNGSRLGRSRGTFSDLSNTSDLNGSLSFFASPFNASNSTKHESGFYSDMDQSPMVKRNLSTSFSTPGVKRVLAMNNNRIPVSKIKPTRVTKTIAPVIQNQDTRKRIELIEPPSPPSAKSYVACSKQSKRNLKRLTR